MGRLYDAVMQIENAIQERGLDAFKTRGEIGLEAGFFLALVRPESPDDPEQLKALRESAARVLGIELGI